MDGLLTEVSCCITNRPGDLNFFLALIFLHFNQVKLNITTFMYFLKHFLSDTHVDELRFNSISDSCCDVYFKYVKITFRIIYVKRLLYWLLCADLLLTPSLWKKPNMPQMKRKKTYTDMHSTKTHTEHPFQEPGVLWEVIPFRHLGEETEPNFHYNLKSKSSLHGSETVGCIKLQLRPLINTLRSHENAIPL